MVGAWKSPKPRRGGVVARGGVFAGGGGTRELIVIHRPSQGVRVEVCATTENMIFTTSRVTIGTGTS